MREHLMYTVLVTFLCCGIILPSSAAEFPENILNKTSDSITIVDQVGRTVTVNLPVTKIVVTNFREMETLLAIGARDKIVGIDSQFHKSQPFFNLNDVPVVAEHASEIDYEKVLLQNPDLVIMPTNQGATPDEVSKKLNNMPVIAFALNDKDRRNRGVQILGAVLGKEDEAEKLIKWTQKYDTIVEERTKNLKPEEMPSFYYEAIATPTNEWNTFTPTTTQGKVAEGCGGRNIASDLNASGGSGTQVGAEWVMVKDPDFIFLDFQGQDQAGVGHTPEDIQANLTNIFESRASEGFENYTAVKNNHVYALSRDWVSGPRWVIGHICFAKWLHPELFEDLDPEAMSKEYFEEFHGMELKGTWAYPAPK
jgi:iron complex transport system substrate-binding protein